MGEVSPPLFMSSSGVGIGGRDVFFRCGGVWVSAVCEICAVIFIFSIRSGGGNWAEKVNISFFGTST